MSSTRKALFFSFAERYAALAIQFVSALIVARILGPEEVGLFSIAFAFTQILSTIRDFGVPQYIVQESELNEIRIRTAQTISIVFSWSLGLLLAISSAQIADFYNDRRVQELVLLLSLNFLLLPFGQVTLGYLQKTFRFEKIMLIGVASAVASAVSVVTLALLGFGPRSMAVANIVGNIVTVAGAFAFRPQNISFAPSLAEARRILAFGTQVTVIHILHAVGSRVPSLIVGKMLSIAAAGAFERASSLLTVFHTAIMQAVWKVTLPLFARDAGEPARLAATYLRVVSYITGVGFPFFAFVGLLAGEVVFVLLGPKWDSSTVVLELLSLSTAIGITVATAENLFIALGRVSIIPKLSLGLYAFQIPLLAMLTPLGLQVCCGVLIVSSMFAVGSTQYLLRKEISPMQFVSALRPSVVATIPVVVVALVARSTIPRGSTIETAAWVGLAAIVSILGWVVVLGLIKHPLHYELRQWISRARMPW